MDALPYATHIVAKLTQAGYTAYFAGGWVRDYIMKHPSSDIDIATDAPPEKILDLFPRTILVGLAFGVVVVVVEGHQFEVSTFRKDLGYEGGRRPTAIEHSDAYEDASRRDFTINGMFYDPLENQIIDYVGGMEDIKRGVIRSIGDPQERFVEDRLRMIRAIRFSSRFGFPMDPATQEAIKENADTLFPAVAMERVWEEFNKMAAYPHVDHAFIELHRLGLLQVIFPSLQSIHLNDIKQRVASFTHLPPKKCPTILYVMELFPALSLREQLDLCQYLRISTREARIVDLIFQMRQKEQEEMKDLNQVDLQAWTHFYANEKAQICLEVIAARKMNPEEREAFLQKHNQRRTALAKHVERIQNKKTVISAADLQNLGILPGKDMGILMKAAEKIAIIHDLNDAQAVLKLLTESSTWKLLKRDSPC